MNLCTNQSWKANKNNVHTDIRFTENILIKIQVNMAAPILNITFIPASNGNVSARNIVDSNNVMKVIFSIISVGSIVPNSLFLMAMLINNRTIRGGYHNILLYNIMVSDTLAGELFYHLYAC